MHSCATVVMNNLIKLSESTETANYKRLQVQIKEKKLMGRKLMCPLRKTGWVCAFLHVGIPVCVRACVSMCTPGLRQVEEICIPLTGLAQTQPSSHPVFAELMLTTCRKATSGCSKAPV